MEVNAVALREWPQGRLGRMLGAGHGLSGNNDPRVYRKHSHGMYLLYMYLCTY